MISVESISEGEHVELINGALTGLKGKVLSQQGKHHFVVELQTVGYAICIQVDASHLRYVA